MKATKVLMRISPFVLALLFGILGSTSDPVSSQSQGQGGLVVVPMPGSAVSGVPLSVMGAGHVDESRIIRCPSLSSGWPCIIVSDKILFTQDNAGGLGIIVSNAEVHDRWTWSYYFPGNPPEGGLPDATCWIEIRGPHEPGNPTDFVALVTNCGGEPTYVQTFPTGCPCNFEFGVLVLIPGWGQFELGTWTTFT